MCEKDAAPWSRRYVMARMFRWTTGVSLGAGGWASVQAQAAAGRPTGSLEIHSESGLSVLLNAEQIAGLPQRTTRTSTAWTDGVHAFEGPLVSDVIRAAGFALPAHAKVQARALNGYVIEIPAEDFVRWPVIVAWSMDGKALTRRDKGPFWIVYPRNDDKVLHDAKYDHRWAWQLQQLTVRSERP
ncbi:hypothetical protein SDC9_88620 [bioreactor metagenome]|uniref:Oxidoreductase molybdopterin-binding domain-containing protein n=1 Tax=bioreactor metagenome TaxID=1076179 RepID=A0A644ZNL3_9ZZZZ